MALGRDRPTQSEGDILTPPLITPAAQVVAALDIVEGAISEVAHDMDLA